MSDRPQPDSPRAWLDRARSDLALARSAMHTRDVLLEDACFHAQQCAEKCLKGLLVHRGISFPRTHAVEALLDLLKLEGAIDVPVDIDDAIDLSQYAAQTRYPGEWEPVTDEEADAAIAMAERVMAWVESQIGPEG